MKLIEKTSDKYYGIVFIVGVFLLFLVILTEAIDLSRNKCWIIFGILSIIGVIFLILGVRTEKLEK